MVRQLTEHVVVPFQGEGSGLGELTWGQLEILPIMQRDDASFSIGGWMPLPEGCTPADVAGDLRFIMSRHASLRTRLWFSAEGHPLQLVAESGEAMLEVVDAGDADPEQIAMALYRRYDEKAFDWSCEWPIRWAVVVSGGAASYLVSVISHLAADGTGVMAVLDDLRSRDPVTGQAKGPVTALQPLELARLQAAPAALRQSDAALRYWGGLLRKIPARRFGGVAEERQPRYWQAFYDSPASYLAVQAVAARTGAGTSTVLLAAYAVALAQVTDSNPAVIQAVVSNRFRRGFAEVVSPLTNFGLCVIDVADITFDEAVARAWRSTMRAYKYAYCDPAKRAELVARISRERGEDVDLACFVNDRRMQSRKEPDTRPPETADLRAALPQSALTWGYRTDDERERCYLHINNVPGTIQFELLGDTQCVSRSDIEALLRGIEVAVTGAVLER